MRVSLALATLLSLALVACGGPEFVVLGRAGLGPGEFDQPRAVDVGAEGVAVIDRSSRLQVLSRDGVQLLTFPVADPESRRGFPVGVTWIDDDLLAVADTHRGAVVIYERSGEMVVRLGEFGARPGQFVQPQRVTVLRDGRLAISDHGLDLANRVQLFDRDGTHLGQFGGPAPEQGGLRRPLGLVELDDGSFVLADQREGLLRYDAAGEFLGEWEVPADATLLYGLTRDPQGDLFVTDLATDTVLRFTPEGEYVGRTGGTGVEPGRFREPWDVAFHSGELYVADRMNHRIQRFDPRRVDWSRE